MKNNKNLEEKIKKIRKKLILNKGIYIFENVKKEEIEEILKLCKEYDDIKSFKINSGEEVDIILRYVSVINEINIKENLKLSKQYFREGNMKKCINLYKEVLSTSNPEPFVYGNIGLYYYLDKNNKAALKYLKVAEYLTKDKAENSRYIQTINQINGIVKKCDIKRYFNMQESDFKTDRKNFYGIDNIYEIANLISEEGLSFYEASDTLNIKVEDRTLIAIIFARECYYQGDYSLGDRYLKIAEKSENKSAVAKKLINEIIKNKKFYKNRTTPEDKILNLRRREKNAK